MEMTRKAVNLTINAALAPFGYDPKQNGASTAFTPLRVVRSSWYHDYVCFIVVVSNPNEAIRGAIVDMITPWLRRQMADLCQQAQWLSCEITSSNSNYKDGVIHVTLTRNQFISLDEHRLPE